MLRLPELSFNTMGCYGYDKRLKYLSYTGPDGQVSEYCSPSALAATVKSFKTAKFDDASGQFLGYSNYLKGAPFNEVIKWATKYGINEFTVTECKSDGTISKITTDATGGSSNNLTPSENSGGTDYGNSSYPEKAGDDCCTIIPKIKNEYVYIGGGLIAAGIVTAIVMTRGKKGKKKGKGK